MNTNNNQNKKDADECQSISEKNYSEKSFTTIPNHNNTHLNANPNFYSTYIDRLASDINYNSNVSQQSISSKNIEPTKAPSATWTNFDYKKSNKSMLNTYSKDFTSLFQETSQLQNHKNNNSLSLKNFNVNHTKDTTINPKNLLNNSNITINNCSISNTNSMTNLNVPILQAGHNQNKTFSEHKGLEKLRGVTERNEKMITNIIQEITNLKEKVNNIGKASSHLKSENTVLKCRLDRIKKESQIDTQVFFLILKIKVCCDPQKELL